MSTGERQEPASPIEHPISAQTLHDRDSQAISYARTTPRRRAALVVAPFPPPLSGPVVSGGQAAEFWRRRRGMDVQGGGRLDAAELRRRLACFRDVQHVEIAEAGHMVHFDAPERMASVILDFLEEAGRAGAE